MMHIESCNPQHVRRRGFSLLIVMFLIAATTVMCWAMLGESSIRVKAATTSNSAILAAQQNEGGVQLALYYLVHPEESKEGTVNGMNGAYWPGGTYDLGLSTMTAEVTPEPDNVFDIKVTTVTDDGVQRTAHRKVVKEAFFEPSHALQVDGKAKVPDDWIITGGVRALGNFTITGESSSDYTDPVMSQNYTSYPAGQPLPLEADAMTVPEYDELTFSSSDEYEYRGTTYNAGKPLLVLPGMTFGPSAFNPLGVFIFNNNKTLRNVTVNGTIIARRELEIDGDVTVNAAEGMPAIVVGDRLKVKSDARLGVRGLVYVGERFESDGNGAMKVQGSLLLSHPESDVLDQRFAGALHLIYDADATRVANFTTVGAERTSFRVLEDD